MKIQKVALVVIALCLLGLLASFIFNNITKQVIYVETGVLMDQYEGMNQVRGEIDKKQKEAGYKMDSIVNAFKVELQNYERERSGMSMKEQELKEQLLKVHQNNVSAMQKALQNEVQAFEQKVTQTQINRINDFINVYGEEQGCDFILGANGSGNVVFAKNSLNVTEDVLEQLNENYRKEYAK